ncbi:S-adenosyl-L-methionine-dependent methyltransferase [Xylaria acuta]|nr:S-adenosyl-L-methionine-dependent methyltransferase [Xylaria acuta]
MIIYLKLMELSIYKSIISTALTFRSLSNICRIHCYTSLVTLTTTRRYTHKMTSENSTTNTKNAHFSRGSMYEKLVGETSTRLSAVALSYLPLSTYTSTSRILDSACGPGIVSKLLLSPSPEYISVPNLPINPPPQVTGIDLSEPMIEQYKANASALGWTTAEAYVQDSQDLARFPDAAFDAVVMGLGIFTLGDAVAGVREMYRVLKPGGHAVVTTWKTRRPQGLMSSAAETIHPGAGKVMDLDPKWSTSEHLATVMVAGGFGAESMQLSEAEPNWRFGSVNALLEALSSPMWTTQFCKGWTYEEMGRWTEEVAKQLTEEEEKTCMLGMVAHVCVARK